ncbi:hypothetical protein GCM10022631_12000 [Deinococcus rubellus]|uniref:DUF4258 domain-containing protein n=1 Tax=Deinococcus rubellus TaxID=1889240 RepID=A0ABY5YEN5_9DEIO|nr:hypothetical protein [Deinococcus rubellus]UWX62754.1 hypothetical protein N0D28_08205 [Deinococcus rubellus]
MTAPAITRHALDRARTRWQCPDDQAAREAIARVIEEGQHRQVNAEREVYTLGSHVCRIDPRACTVVTVLVRGQRRLKRLCRQMRGQ